jgi:hypothetical protein
MILWLMRPSFSTRAVILFRWICSALFVAVAAWLSIKIWGITLPAVKSGTIGAAQLRDIFALRMPAVIGVALLWWFRNRIGVRTGALLCAGLLALSIFVLPAAFKQYRTLASPIDIDEFRDWRMLIPPTSTVLVTPSRDVGTFVWFTLQRPNYLAVDQSAGVVFSRATALEVRRRAQVLLPIMDPDWKIRTHLRSVGTKLAVEESGRPLTSKSLRDICDDSQLGFVISHEHLGFDGIAHENTGAWQGWELYACSKIRMWRAGK